MEAHVQAKNLGGGGGWHPNSEPPNANPSGGSQFWKALVKVRDEFSSLVKFKVDKGTYGLAGYKGWPLSLSFHVLFSYYLPQRYPFQSFLLITGTSTFVVLCPSMSWWTAGSYCPFSSPSPER